MGSVGVQGIQSGLADMTRQAESIANLTAKDGSAGDIAEAAVGLRQAELQVAASAKVVEAANRVSQHLIDIRV